jgi:hypothetical protein
MHQISDPMRLLLRAEGAALAVAAIAGFAWTGGSWWLFAALILVPDIAIAGYLAGPRLGALAYNLLHVTVGPLALAVTGLAGGSRLMLGIALIWLAHIGIDRALGYGLKETSGFKDTHLGRIGG